METNITKILVYADWLGLNGPKLMGTLSIQSIRGRQIFSFQYELEFLESKQRIIIDPNLEFFSGIQYPANQENFGVFLDSMPDTWGRTLMKRRAAQIARENSQPAKKLFDIDFLLGVYDKTRIGGLRFKIDPKGDFLDNNEKFPTPPWGSIREVQYGISVLERSENEEEINKWLNILIAPGSSLGGARPKANILDTLNELWIAKFPSKNDTIDKGAWEYLAYKLAIKAGIQMSDSLIQKVTGNHHTFFTKRFDRKNKNRLHFASAMTMTGNNETIIRDTPASYLEIAEFIQNYGSEIKKDLTQLWRRIVFNILISNTDDHLRNHGFLIKDSGWRLSPAFDINPSVDKNGLALNIDMQDSSLDLELAKSVGEYFQLSSSEMEKIISEVKSSVKSWEDEAVSINISREEQIQMASAFRSFE